MTGYMKKSWRESQVVKIEYPISCNPKQAFNCALHLWKNTYERRLQSSDFIKCLSWWNTDQESAFNNWKAHLANTWYLWLECTKFPKIPWWLYLTIYTISSIDNAHNPNIRWWNPAKLYRKKAPKKRENILFMCTGRGALLSLIACQAGFLLMLLWCSQIWLHNGYESRKNQNPSIFLTTYWKLS
jgi:hypothetical protein